MFVSSSVSIERFAAACGRYWRGAPRAECVVDSVPVGKQHRALIVQIEQKSLEVPQSQYPEQVLDVLVVTQQPYLHFFDVYRCPIGTSEVTPSWFEGDLGSVVWIRLPRTGKDHHHPFFQKVSLWFEEDPVSEVVFRFDVGHVHHHLHLPVRLRRH